MPRKLRNIFDQYEQKENHITNSLLLVLNSNRALLKSILIRYRIRLTSKQINLLSQVAPKTVDQRSTVPDGYIYTDDYNLCVGIETKIQPKAVRKEQIVGHLNQLSAYEKSFLLILTPDEQEPSVITKLKHKYSNVRFISWPELLKFMIEVGADKKNNQLGQYLFDEFMNYMERSFYMTPFTGFRFSDGYDLDLAIHYVKRVSATLTPLIQKKFPDCLNKRPKILGAWEAWSGSEKIQESIHPAFVVEPHQVRCFMVLPNACPRAWKRIRDILTNDKLKRMFKHQIGRLYDKSPKGAETVISFRQRHFYARTKAISDAQVIINVATLLGKDGSKKNIIWWNLLEDIARSKSKYNYQMEIAYDMKYDRVPALQTTESIEIMKKCFSSLKPMYDFISKF